MAIQDAVYKAYENASKRGWNKIYVGVDIHDTLAESNYKQTMPELIPEAVAGIKYLNTLPEMCLCLFSSCHPHDYNTYMEYFKENGMHFDYFNENPRIENTKTGDFSKKFYYSLILDDKAGFLKSDWKILVNSVSSYRYLIAGLLK